MQEKICVFGKKAVLLRVEKEKMKDKLLIYGGWLLVVVGLLLKCYAFDCLVLAPQIAHWGWTGYLTKIAASMMLALPFLWCRRKWIYGLVVFGLTDLWFIANVVYFRAYHLFITWHLFALAGNMSGFESSITPYLSWSLLVIMLPSVLVLPCIFLPLERANWKGTLVVLILSVLASAGGSISRWLAVRPWLNGEGLSWEWFNPCSLPKSLSEDYSEHERQASKYIRSRSMLGYPLYMIYDAVETYRHRGVAPELTEEERAEVEKRIGPKVPQNEANGSLVILLLESFESWLIEAEDVHGNPVCPAMRAYIETHPVLYVKDVATQIQFGMSGDGQLIVNTGLFPTLEGVACMDYGYNTYPNLAHFYPRSAVVNPCRNVWNQAVVTTSYGYRQLVEPKSENRFEWNDSIVVDKMITTLEGLGNQACVMGITVSGHLPFDTSRDRIEVSEEAPEWIRNYLQTAHFTDRQVGRLLAWADTAKVMENSVIAITGDHRIFHAWINDELREYGLKAGLPFGTSQAGCPLIVKSPKIEELRVVENGEQVDIFPTILDAIGQENYYWKGFGRDLLQEAGKAEEEGPDIRRQVSDKLIRMDYFAEK